MNTFHKAFVTLAIGAAAAAAQAQMTIVVEGSRTVDPAALVGEDSGSAYFASLPLGPGLDRGVVVAELDHARSSGELGAYVGEDSGSAWLAQHPASGAVAATGGVTTLAWAAR